MNRSYYQLSSQLFHRNKRTGSFAGNVFIPFLLTIIFTSSVFAQEQLKLIDCIEMAMKNNPEVKNAKRNVLIAKTLKTSAFSAFLPSLSAGINSSQTRVAPQLNNRVVYQGIELSEGAEYESPGFRTNNHSVGGTVTQLLFDGGSSINRIRQETANVEAAISSERNMHSKTILQCKRLFYEIRRVEEQIRVAQKSYEETEQQLNQLELLMKNSGIPKLDIYRARVARNNSKIQLLNLKPQLENAVSELNVFMGRSANTTLKIIPENENVKSLSYTHDDAINLAIENNTVLISQKHAIEAQQRGVAAVRAEFLPSLNLTGSYYRYNSSFDNVYGKFDKNYNIYFGISASYNLFDGFDRESSLQREALKLSIAKETYESARISVIEKIKNIVNKHEIMLETLDLQEESTHEASEALRILRGGYKTGQATLLDVIDAEKNLITTEFQRINTYYDLIINEAELESFLGKE